MSGDEGLGVGNWGDGPVAGVSGEPPKTQPPNPLRIWLSAARLKTLPAAAAPVLLGTAFAAADRDFHAGAALCALAGALLIQVGTNYANDAEDFARGADTAARVGPKRAVNEGWVTAGQMRLVAALAFGAAFASGMFLVWRGGWPILALGVVAIASGYAYTKGRYALAYTGLADLFVFVFFGPVAVGGTYYVQALSLPPHVLVAGLGPGALATAILIANNVRDAEQDRAADKRTLVVRFGRTFGIALYTLCFAVAVLAPIAALARWWEDDKGTMLVTGPLPAWSPFHQGALAASVVALVAMPILVRLLWRSHGAAAGPVLGKTAAVLLVYSVAFAAGWLWT